MTDEELIQRLQETSVGDLTPDDLEALRARWTQSPELRHALIEHLRLESLLITSLGAKQLDIDAIMQRAQRGQPAQHLKRPFWFWFVGMCLLLGIGSGFILYLNKVDFDKRIAKVVPVERSTSQQTTEPQPAQDAPAAMDVSKPETNVALETPVKPTEQHPVEQKPDTNRDVAPDPALVQVAQNEPWSDAFSRNVAPWSANSAHWTDNFKAARHDEFPDSEGKRWFAQTEGQPYNWSTDQVGNPPRRITRFNGLAKLRAPWPQDAVLRVTPFEVADLTFYFWRGPTGVALRFYTRREPHLWAAFEISRENSSPKPTRWGLLTTDNGSYARSTPGTFDIRQQNDHLVLARGGIVLISVPFLGVPLEVYLEGQFRLRGLSMHRSAPFVTSPDNTHPTIVGGRAVDLPWAISQESPADLKDNADGSVTVTVDSQHKNGLISLPFGWMLAAQQSVHAKSLFEVIVGVESADPGTGIYLGDRDGRPIQQLGFFRDSVTQQVAFGVLRPGQAHTEVGFNLHDFPPPYLSKPGWFKLTAGLGTFHIQTSGDGHHWGHIIENPIRDLPGAVASMGLYGLKGSGPRSIRIREVQIRELNGITDLADARLKPNVPAFTKDQLNDLARWRHSVLDTRPMDADSQAWLATCAIAALSQGPSKEVGLDLLRQLVAVELKSNRTFEQKLRLLNDACSLCDLHDEGHARTLGRWYEELGWQLAKSGDPEPLATLRPAWLWSPIWTTGKMKYVWEPLLSHEILQAVYRREWSTAWRVANSTSYWNLQPHPDMHPTDRGEFLERQAKWAKAIVSDAAPEFDNGSAGILAAGLRHPLAPVLNKEAYNVRAELQSALSGGSYEDACRILTSVGPSDGQGLLPDIEDRDLYVSMWTSVMIARQAHPDFAAMMSEKLEPVGVIRVKGAINRRDFAGLQAATLQFMGTNAARSAHAWLGDMALSAGQFASAEQHFRQAALGADDAYLELLEPRNLLARALNGRLSFEESKIRVAKLPDHAVDFNGNAIPRDQFAKLIDDAVTHHSLANSLKSTALQAEFSLPPSAYQLEKRSHFEGQAGNNPGRWDFRFGDPVGRQIAAVADDQRIYISNRFQVNAYSAETGQLLWAQGVVGDQGDAYAMPFTPMKPLPANDRLFVRRLTKAGAELACLNAANGDVVWSQRPFQSALADPVIWHGKLFSLILVKAEENLLQVEAAWFDVATGAVLTTRPLFRLQEIPDRQFSAQLAVQEHVGVCTVGGTTACFDSQGEINWVRRHLLMLKSIDDFYEDQRQSPPIFTGQNVIVSQPGVRAVACLDCNTGRVIWQQPLTNLRGVRGVSGSRVIVDTVSSLLALDVETGQIAWSYDGESRCEGLLVDAPNLLVTRRVTFANHRSKPAFVWLDLHSGQEIAQTLMQTPDREEFQIGPFFHAGGKRWALAGQTWKESNRDLVEILTSAAPRPETFRDDALVDWSPVLRESTLAEIEAVVPGFFPVADYHDRLKIHHEEVQGESFILLSRLDPKHEVRFIHMTNPGTSRQNKLLLRVGNRPGQKWNLTIRNESRVLYSQVIEDSNGQNGWRSLTVDLTALAARPSEIQVIQSCVDRSATDALLKRVEFIVE